MNRTTPTRRGIALLLVLATLVLAVSAAAGLARVAAGVRLRADRAEDVATADQILRATDAPILDWLQRHAGRLVLPADAVSPRFTVLDDSMQIGDRRCQVVVTAFDQCGMVPGIARCAPTDACLPPDALESLAHAGNVFSAHPGLDLLESGERQARRVFPGADGSNGPRALGEILATHNPVHSGTPAVININTAPMDLIRAVYAARGLGGIETVLGARVGGRIASPGAMDAPRTGGGDDAPLPVAMSAAWAFRVDCFAGRVRRSWWCVYTDSGSNWERVQRIAIDE